MADSGKNAITTFSHDGSRTTYPVGFPFLDPVDVYVTVGGVQQVLNTAHTIDEHAGTLTFSVVPAAGTLVMTRRSKRSGTDDGSGGPVGNAPILVYTPSEGVRLKTLIRENLLQILYYLEEVGDKT